MFEAGRRFLAIYLTCGMISLARFSSAYDSKPTDLQVTSVRDLTIMLKWKRPLTTAGSPNSSVLTYTVLYQAVGSGAGSRQQVPALSESAEIGLQNNKLYNIYVKTARPNQSAWSDVFRVDTKDLVPAKPTNLRVSSSAKRLQIIVVWNTPQVTVGGITDTSTLNYYIRYKNLENRATRQVQSSTERAVLNLKANTMYEIKVKSFKIFNTRVAGSWSDSLIIKTNESVPSKPPTNVKVVSSTLSSIKVSWGPIPKDGRNGIILGYAVFYREGTSGPWSERDVSGMDVYAKELTGLTSGNLYSVRVAGYTKIGRGTPSTRIIVGVSEKPHSTSTIASRTARVKTVGTVKSVSTEVSRNTTDVLPTDPYTKISTRSSGGTALKSSSIPSVPDSGKEDHSLYSTPVAASIGRAHEVPKKNSLKKVLMIGVPVACLLLLLIILIVFIGRSRKRKQLHQNGEVTKSKRRKWSKDPVTRGAFSVRYEPPSGNTTLGSDSMNEGLLQSAEEPDQPVIIVQEANDSPSRAEAEDVPLIRAGNSNNYDHLRVDLSAGRGQLEEGRASGLYESIGSLGKAGCSHEAKPDEGKSDDEERYVTQEQIDATRDKAQSQVQPDYNSPNGHYKTPKADVHYKTPKTRVAKDVPDYQNVADKEHVYETLGVKDPDIPEDPVYENAKAALPDNADRGEQNESSSL